MKKLIIVTISDSDFMKLYFFIGLPYVMQSCNTLIQNSGTVHTLDTSGTRVNYSHEFWLTVIVSIVPQKLGRGKKKL